MSSGIILPIATRSFLASSAYMSHLPTLKATHRLCRNKNAIVGSLMCEVNVVGWGNIGIEHNLYLSAKRHDVRQMFVFETKGNRPNWGNYFTESRNMFR